MIVFLVVLNILSTSSSPDFYIAFPHSVKFLPTQTESARYKNQIYTIQIFPLHDTNFSTTRYKFFHYAKKNFQLLEKKPYAISRTHCPRHPCANSPLPLPNIHSCRKNALHRLQVRFAHGHQRHALILFFVQELQVEHAAQDTIAFPNLLFLLAKWL